MISEYDVSFGYEYKLYESLKMVCQTADENLTLRGCSRQIQPFQHGMHTTDK